MAYATINKPSDYFNTVLYTGNVTARSITGVGFQPDWIWFKKRSSPAQNHTVYDSTRGTNKILFPDVTDAESTNSSQVTSFDSDGFSLGTGTLTNYNTGTYVAWNWLANGGTTSSNTDGTITSTVQANTTAGFSIVTYTGNSTAGATVGHGLGKVPAWTIIKNRGQSNNWVVYHHKNTSAPETEKIQLDATGATADTSDPYNDTAPTSSVFTLGSWDAVNSSSYTYVAYCFAEIEGYSKFGSYTGNGSTDGTFVYTGFKPAWLMVKRTDSAEGWFIHSDKIGNNIFNPVERRFQANESQEEVGTTNAFDFLSNGFKLRTDTSSHNGTGGTFIYMAFAENPLVGTNGIPATAR